MVIVTLTQSAGKQQLTYNYDKKGDSGLDVDQTAYQGPSNIDDSSELVRVYDMRNFTQLSIMVDNNGVDEITYDISECYKPFDDITAS